MDLGIRGKRALVGASSKGLGRAIAEELAAAGCDLFLCSRGEERLHETRDAIAGRHGVRVVAETADLVDPAAAQTVVEHALAELGSIDILVTNNGGPPAGPFESHSLEMWQESYHRLLGSALILVKGVLPGMKERGWGRILNVTSSAVKQPIDDLVLSTSMRAALTGMARTLANEVAPFGVTVNNIMPGYIGTDRLDQLAEVRAAGTDRTKEDMFASWSAAIPTGRVGEPREFGAVAAFLASERASYITGQSIAVDGGLVRSLI